VDWLVFLTELVAQLTQLWAWLSGWSWLVGVLSW
jgi:hypothetical protein